MALSDVFKYISKFRHAGHQVGRKVGDMLEVLTYAALNHDPELRARLQIEPKIFGFCEAGHKVEFGILAAPGEGAAALNSEHLEDPTVLIGIIECKKVGVEQTIGQGYKKAHGPTKYQFPPGATTSFYMGRNTAHPARVEVGFAATNDPSVMKLSVGVNGKLTLEADAATGHRVIFARTTQGGFVVIPNEGSLRDVAYPLEACRILEVTSVVNGVATMLINDCLPGPQTPEKAKQASFVALDIRKKRFGQFDKRENEREMPSVLVLTEFSHWETKSQNMVKACLDEVLVVPDELIIEAFEEFERVFGPDFYALISKEQYATNRAVAAIVDAIIQRHDGVIFVNAFTGARCSLRYQAGQLRIL